MLTRAEKSAEVAAGKRAEFIVFDPGASTYFTREFMRSKSINTPFLDRQLDGAVERVVLGEEVLLDRLS